VRGAINGPSPLALLDLVARVDCLECLVELALVAAQDRLALEAAHLLERLLGRLAEDETPAGELGGVDGHAWNPAG
jgi:hypothetical protein